MRRFREPCDECSTVRILFPIDGRRLCINCKTDAHQMALVASLDWKAGEQRLEEEHVELSAGPRAPSCSCRRPWLDDGDCAKCGRAAA